MENLCKGILFGFATGLVVGGIMVAKNKKLAGKIKQGLGMAEEKIEEAKDMVKEKIEECQEKKEQEESENNFDSMKSFPSKNSKK